MWAGEGKARAEDSLGSPATVTVTTVQQRQPVNAPQSPTEERPGDPDGGALVMPRDIRTEPGRGCTPALFPAAARDASLARHAQDTDKRRLRAAADVVARDLIARDGSTNSPRVVAELRARGLGHLLFGLDARCMGTVLLPTRGYEETGEYVNEGSKGRPAKMWRLA